MNMPVKLQYFKNPKNRELTQADLDELARELDAELILIGCSGRTGWGAALIGNTAEQVVDSLKCDLLVVKPDPAPTA